MRKKLFSVGIKDCRVETFTAGGHGGAGKDTSNTAVRITHPPSSAVGVGSDHRSQLRNKQDAFSRMAKSKEFLMWAKLKAAELSTGKTVDEVVLEQMQSDNLKVEYRTEKGWEVVPAEDE